MAENVDSNEDDHSLNGWDTKILTSLNIDSKFKARNDESTISLE